VEKVGSSLFNIVDSRAVGSISISVGSGSGVHFSEEKVVVSLIAMRWNVQTVLEERKWRSNKPTSEEEASISVYFTPLCNICE
jgi:hypothetical protein